MQVLSALYWRRIIGVTFISCISGFAMAQDLQSKLPVDPEVVTGKLANGLTYYIRPNHKPEHKVELRLAVKAGSILENDDQQGLAHFMEHMNFNGTKNFQKNELVSYLQSIGVQFGADLNAYTSFDQTVYILPIPLDKPDNLEKGFQIIEDWAHNALLTDKDIDEERGVVLEESRLGKGAEDRMLKKYFPKMAAGSIYASRLPIGTDDVIKNSSYEKTRSFYKDWYRPDLQSVMVVGDIDVETAKKMINDHFAGIKNPANEKPRKYVDVSPRKTSEAMVVTDKEATNSQLVITFPYAKKNVSATLGDYKKDLVAQITMAMLNRRLNDLAQGGNPPFAYAGAEMDGLIHGYQAFTIAALFENTGAEKALMALTGEVVRAQKFGFTTNEMELAKREMMSNIERAFNERKTTDSRAYVEEFVRVFLDNEAMPGIANEFSYYKLLLPTITENDVNAQLKLWTANANTFTLITAPEKGDVKLPKDSELLAMTKKGFSQVINKTEEKKVAISLMQGLPTSGKVISQTKEEGFEATTYTLSNGIKVTIKPTDFKSDEILMTAVRKGGKNGYGLADRSNVQFATDLVEAMGLATFTPNEMEKIIAGKNVKVDVEIGDFSNSVKGSSSVKDFETMMQLTHLYLTNPRKDEELYKAYKEKQTGMLQFMMSNPRAAFIDTTVKSMYSNNPLARMVIPRPSDFDKINLDRALEIYKNELCGGDGYHFFFVGNIKPELTLQFIESYLGGLPSTGKPRTVKDNGVRTVKGVNKMEIKKGKEKQSLIMSIYSGEIPYSEDLALKTQALAEVLNIKVIEEMREKMGAIYGGGFNGTVSKEPYERYSIQLQLPCGPENVEKLLTAAKDEIEKLKANGPSEKDVEKVKNQWKEKYITDVKENKYWNGKMESVLFWGREKDRVLKYQSFVDKLTPADIQETAKKLLNGNNQFTSVLYPES